MRTVYKLILHPGENKIPDPWVKVVHVAEQRGELCVWYELNTYDGELEFPDYAFTRLYVYGTGHEIIDNEIKKRHVGSALMDDGNLVFHVYEQIR